MMDEANIRPEEAAETTTPEAETAPKAEKAPAKEKKETKKDLEAQLAAAKAEAEKARAEADEAKDRLLRTAAEYDNFRKRSAREQDAAFTILDTLEMAEAAPTADENFKKGVTLTLEKAKAAFQALKVEEIPALGLPFDPAVHNAVMQRPAENGEESGTVLQVFQKGYKLGDKVIRHATVIVAE